MLYKCTLYNPTFGWPFTRLSFRWFVVPVVGPRCRLISLENISSRIFTTTGLLPNLINTYPLLCPHLFIAGIWFFLVFCSSLLNIICTLCFVFLLHIKVIKIFWMTSINTNKHYRSIGHQEEHKLIFDNISSIVHQSPYQCKHCNVSAIVFSIPTAILAEASYFSHVVKSSLIFNIKSFNFTTDYVACVSAIDNFTQENWS